MKRSWIGAALLAVLLIAGGCVTWAMGNIHSPISRELESAAQYALEEDWTQAEALEKNANTAWQKSRDFSACFADHDPMEEIDEAFAQLEVYARCREEVAFAAEAAQLARKVQAMGEAHGLLWWNIL